MNSFPSKYPITACPNTKLPPVRATKTVLQHAQDILLQMTDVVVTDGEIVSVTRHRDSYYEIK